MKHDVRNFIKTNEKPAIVLLAEAQGHKVWFTPPYHSDLQPIELTWAFVKGNVGRQYNSQTSLNDVYERLKQEFNNLETQGHVTILKMIEKCAQIGKYFMEEEEDNDQDYTPDSDMDDSGDDASDRLDGDIAESDIGDDESDAD